MQVRGGTHGIVVAKVLHEDLEHPGVLLVLARNLLCLPNVATCTAHTNGSLEEREREREQHVRNEKTKKKQSARLKRLTSAENSQSAAMNLSSWFTSFNLV